MGNLKEKSKIRPARMVSYVFFVAVGLFMVGSPAYAVSNTNSMLADPARYFPGCTCSASFVSFIVWMITLLIIAMFQYGEKKKSRKLGPVWFSIVAIILFFLYYSIPLWIMVWLLQPSGFDINPETGQYEFSMHGEMGTDTMPLTGKYTPEELTEHLYNSRRNIITTWVIITSFCAGTIFFVPAFLKQQAKKREQAIPIKRKKRPSKGRIGTRVVRDKGRKGKEH